MPGDVFAKVAKDIAARYRGFVEAEDIEQELWVWWLSHEQPDLDNGDWAPLRTLYTVAERYCKAERTARQGPASNYAAGEVFTLVEMLVNPPSDLTADLVLDVKGELAKLPADLKDPLTARAAGESFRSIADRTGLSVATVHRRVQQALSTVVNALNGVAQA